MKPKEPSLMDFARIMGLLSDPPLDLGRREGNEMVWKIGPDREMRIPIALTKKEQEEA